MTQDVRNVSGWSGSTCSATYGFLTRRASVSGVVQYRPATCGSRRSVMGRTTWRGSTISQKAGDTHSTIAYVNLGWSGLFFDQRDMAGQALWMDLALARQSGQELHNYYVLTTSPTFGNLRKLFRAAVRDTVLIYNDYPGSRVAPVAHLRYVTRCAWTLTQALRGPLAHHPWICRRLHLHLRS